MERREFLGAVTASLVAGATTVPSGQAAPGAQPAPAPVPPRNGRIKQGVTRGVFGRAAVLDDSCREAARLGIKGFDLIGRCPGAAQAQNLAMSPDRATSRRHRKAD